MTAWALASTAAALATVALGSLVAYQAYRGYRRNGSRPMAALAVGVVCLAVIPGAIDQLIALCGGPAAVGALTATGARVLGLVAVLYALTRA